MAAIEIYSAVHDNPFKGHDRSFVDTDRIVAGVFDGAGGAELSEAIVRNLPLILSARISKRAISEELFLADVLQAADSLPEGRSRRATAAVASVSLRDSSFHIAHGNAGDSRVYFYDHQRDCLTRLAHSPTIYKKKNGRTRIDSSEFLGNFRRIDKIKSLVGKLVVPAAAEWSIIGCSDGVQDDKGRGITKPALRNIIRSRPASEIPGAVLSSIEEPYDDASIFIMSHRQSEL